jgi:hemolysin III
MVNADKKLIAPTIGEEIANSVSHGIGSVFAIAGTAVAIVWAVIFGNMYSVISASIYGATLIILYTMSTLYHAFTNKTVKRVFRIFDHCSIFLLIAGTYTPYALVTLNGPTGWTVFGIIWGAAIIGIVLNAISLEKFKVLSMICYLAMGWLIVLYAKPLTEKLGFMPATFLLLLGGILYTIGAIFYCLKRIKYMHGVWHLFVLGGSILHYLSILIYVLPVNK